MSQKPLDVSKGGNWSTGWQGAWTDVRGDICGTWRWQKWFFTTRCEFVAREWWLSSLNVPRDPICSNGLCVACVARLRSRSQYATSQKQKYVAGGPSQLRNYKWSQHSGSDFIKKIDMWHAVPEVLTILQVICCNWSVIRGQSGPQTAGNTYQRSRPRECTAFDLRWSDIPLTLPLADRPISLVN